MEWGYTDAGNRRHVLAEDPPELGRYAGIALCGILLPNKFHFETLKQTYEVCRNCQTLLSAMESV